MIKISLNALGLALFLASGAASADLKADCEAKALDKNGKPLAGAAKDAKVKKCVADASAPTAEGKSDCEAKALDKNGKKLAGAAKDAFVKKCEKDALAKK